MEVKSEEVDGKPREIDLTWLRKPPETFKEPSDAMVAMSEHRRFVQVAVRTLALEREHLIAQGRKVVCQDSRLVTDAVALKFGREMWFGYIAQVEVVNGGLQPSGNLGPARTTLSHLASLVHGRGAFRFESRGVGGHPRVEPHRLAGETRGASGEIRML